MSDRDQKLAAAWDRWRSALNRQEEAAAEWDRCADELEAARAELLRLNALDDPQKEDS